MKIDITSLCFGFKITKENDSGTPAWATSIGQAPKGVCYIDTSREGLDDIVYGMMYNAHSDFENLKVRDIAGVDKREEPRSDRERMMFSVFHDVYVNGLKVEGDYILTFEREDSDSHKNRLHICYAKYLTYNGHANKFTLQNMAKVLGCNEEACWFVKEINVINQTELHFTAVVVNPTASMVYANSHVRKDEWTALEAIVPEVIRGDINKSQQSYLTAIRTKPFLLLAGISGTGKSRIVRKLAQATDDIDAFANDAERFSCHSPANFCLIQVKPNWHNSMDVVGFKSNIGKDGEHYEYTPFIEFIGKAWQNLNTPFFLCLDEMNLAPVEEYFAEFLSAIESRSIDANGSYETDPIIKPFKDFGDKVAFEMIKHLIGEDTLDSDLAKRLYHKGLTLPQNLIVMGTVNMDDTTFSFSRKVLDRAMSIEMNEVSYDDFISGASENDIPTLTALNSLLVNRPIKAQSVKDEDSYKVIDFLKNINEILEGTPYKLGYRAANEALLYVASAKAFGNGNLASALDDFTLMKVLSRIEGDESKLKTAAGKDLLEELMDLLNSTFEDGVDSKSKAKLNQMINILRREHFVSFWG